MEQKSQSGRVMARVVTVDLIVALIIFALGALVVYESHELGASWSSDGPQAGYFPFYIGLLTCVSSAVVFVQSVLRLRADAKAFVELGQLKQVMIVLVPTVVYVLCVQLVGLYLSAAVFIALFMRLVGKYSWLRGASVGLGVSAAAFMMFEIWFLIPLPKGPVETFLGY